VTLTTETLVLALASALGGAAASRLALRRRESPEMQRAQRWGHWQELLESLPIPACVKDRTGRYVFANRVMLDWFRHRGVDLPGKRDADVMPAHIAAWLRETEESLWRGEAPMLEQEVNGAEWLPGAGTGRWLLKKMPIDGAPWGKGILVLAYDVTELHDTQVELARQRDFVQAVLDSSDALIAVLDAAGKLVRWNRKCDAATGYHESEVRGKLLAEVLVPPEFRDDVQRDFARILAGEHIQGETLEIEARDGRRLILEISAGLVRDETGEPEWVVVTAIDRTAERQAEARWRELSLERDALWKNSGDALAFVDREGRIVAANPAFCRLTGIPEPEAAGKPLTEAMSDWPGFEQAELNRFREQFRRRAIEPRSTKELRLADGRKRWLELGCTWVARTNGEPLLLVSARDVTDRIRSEQELRAANEFLEATALWAKELAAKAESASSAKTAFLAHVSHELRTPMNGILGMLDLALKTRLDAEQREYLEMARDAAESLLGLVDDLLDVAKAESGRLGVSPEPIALRETLNQAMRLLIHRASAKGLEVRWRVAPDVPERIVADPARLRQVIQNLAGNALKFTSQGAVELSVDRVEAARGPRLRFLVRDTGPGIPAERWHQVFQPFARFADPEVAGEGGSGLGLTIAASLVEGMGGWLLLGSEPGCGTQFCFTLPLREEPPSPAAAGGVSSAAGAEPSASAAAGRARILVAEDNAVNQRVIRGLLEKEGFAVTVVADGSAAVQEALSGRHDLVLMDVQMPGMDGWAAARAIREGEPAGRRIPIIAMTARALEEDGPAAQESGMDGYLAKPVRITELVEMIGRFLRAAPAAGAAATTDAGSKRMSMQQMDIAGALERLGGDRALLAELAGLFLEEGPRLLGELRHALDQGDAHGARNAAHQLKGLLAQFCAAQAREAAWEVELAAREADLLQARAKLAGLEPLMDRLRPELERLARGEPETA